MNQDTRVLEARGPAWRRKRRVIQIIGYSIVGIMSPSILLYLVYPTGPFGWVVFACAIAATLLVLIGPLVLRTPGSDGDIGMP